MPNKDEWPRIIVHAVIPEEGLPQVCLDINDPKLREAFDKIDPQYIADVIKYAMLGIIKNFDSVPPPNTNTETAEHTDKISKELTRESKLLVGIPIPAKTNPERN